LQKLSLGGDPQNLYQNPFYAKGFLFMVGASGYEPPTSYTQCKRASR
jgi:hypothetical protein